MKKVDLIIVFVVLVMAAIGMTAMGMAGGESGGEKYVEIWSNGQMHKRVDISDGHSEKIKIETEHGYNIVYIHDGGAEVIEADCNDGICVDMGLIKSDGEIIACLPHKMYVKIVSDTENKVDAISQ